jgi:hypothetical protein
MSEIRRVCLVLKIVLMLYIDSLKFLEYHMMDRVQKRSNSEGHKYIDLYEVGSVWHWSKNNEIYVVVLLQSA